MIINVHIEIPKYWYNIVPDLPRPLPPPINPQTRNVVKPEEFEVLFAKELVRQKFSTDMMDKNSRSC